ncbi:hypothetical protein JD844_013504 [Phrynosoma platyrhinos]|uniref:Uncharacterized protein n=1 Tax=Phrynosoma platyrhinos TaxID=52577 RepID=A0ABQ7TLD0_PHRPL|nr:hypothetical protein JD844_013504 [Phrynosoma platyrhinos]
MPPAALVCLVEGLPRLVKLDLAHSQCDKGVLSALASCRQLQELDISWCDKLSLASLPHLAYDCTQESFTCQALEKLDAYGLGGKGNQFSALAFMLLALSHLKHLGHKCVSKAVVMIHKRQFKNARLPRGFPSLTELTELVISTQMNEGRSTFALPLLEIDKVDQSCLPVVRAMCPLLASVKVQIKDNSALAPNFFPWHSLTHLDLRCRKDSPRDLRDLLPVTAFLGAQLQSLAIHNFSFVEEFSFHALLCHCPKLQDLKVSFFSPPKPRHDRQPDIGATDLDFSLPFEFPQLSNFFLEYSKKQSPLPRYHAKVLRQCIVALMIQSPCLKRLNLTRLPFSLDQVFKEVLKPSGAALQQLCELSLVQVMISKDTIHLLLSLENPLNFLVLKRCPGINEKEYEELQNITFSKGLDLNIDWQ